MYSKRPSDCSPSTSHLWISIVYYRIYDEDGPTTSKTPAPGDPFLGRINAQFVPPPYRDTARAVKRHIAKMENINDRESSSLFTSPYSKSPMGNTDKVTALNRTASCLGSTPQDPLAFVTKFSGSALESEGRGGLESAAEPDTTRDSEIRYGTSIQHSPALLFVVLTSQLLGEVYYLLYADDYELPSKVAFDPEEPSLGRIRVDSIVPPHSSVTIKRCISRVERTPTIASVHAHLFAEISCNTPLKDDHISFLRTNYPGMSPKEPMAIVLTSLSPIPDGRYVIKNRTVDFFWNAAWDLYMRSVYFGFATIETAMSDDGMNTQVNRQLFDFFFGVFRE